MKIKIHKNIRKKPLILGLNNTCFMFYSCITIGCLLLFISGFTFWKVILTIIFSGISYLLLKIITEKPYIIDDFLEKKIPTYIENIPSNERNKFRE